MMGTPKNKNSSALHSGLVGRRKCGYLYDAEMEKHHCAWDPIHIETPERMRTIRSRLEGLIGSPLQYCIPVKSRKASLEEICSVHTDHLINDVCTTCRGDPGVNQMNYKDFSERYQCAYVNEFSLDCALLAAGSTVDLVDMIYNGQLDNGLAVVRPPGHHAFQNESNGFCIFNNVAVAARHLIDKRNAKRILIIDWDVHHGQGTQRIFYGDNRVLYCSIHKYDQGEAWPHLRESNFDCIGTGNGQGYNVNVPLNAVDMGDAEYMAIFLQVLLPIAYEYNPEIVIVSAGYDAALGCPEGHMRVTPAMYGHLTHALTSLAGGKVAVILEGGYCLDSLAEGVACTLESLLGLPPCPLLSLGPADPIVVSAVLNIISALRPYWKCLQFQETEPKKSKFPAHQPRIIFNGPSDNPPNEAYVLMSLYTPAETVEFRHEIQALKKYYDTFRQGLSGLERTGYVYDEIMTQHIVELDATTTPEIAQRITSIYNQLAKEILPECVHIPSRDVTSSELELVHAPQYVQLLSLKADVFADETSRRTSGAVRKSDQWPGDVWATKGSQPAIICAAGSLLNLVDAVLMGKCLNGFAIIRPPGHHAHHDYPAGFCFANNVAIAAKHALEKYSLKRILIVDWDVHHGDGVQEAFYGDSRILYISLHRGDEFYPFGAARGAKYTGEGNGQGFNMNIPWKQRGMGDGDYIAAFQQLILPVAYEFVPELVLVSCGFDAARGDPLGGCAITEIGYGIMTRMLMSLAGGKVVLALEGGYNLQMLASCSESVMKALLGYSLSSQNVPLVPSELAVKDIKGTLDAHIKVNLWKCLQYRVVLLDPIDETEIRSTTASADESVRDATVDDLVDTLSHLKLIKKSPAGK